MAPGCHHPLAGNVRAMWWMLLRSVVGRGGDDEAELVVADGAVGFGPQVGAAGGELFTVVVVPAGVGSVVPGDDVLIAGARVRVRTRT